MVQLAINFMKEKEKRKEKLHSEDYELKDEFKDYVFKIYLFSYIKKTIVCSSLQLIKKNRSLIQQEELTLNIVDQNYNEERINLIRDTESGYLDSLLENDYMCLEEVLLDDDVLKAIYKLTNRQKEILYKSIIMDKKDTVIAKELGISKQAVGKSKNAALSKLKEILLNEKSKL